MTGAPSGTSVEAQRRRCAWHADGRIALLGWLWRAQWRAQRPRALTAVVAIAIGVALALAIQLVNHSALAEFTTALSVINGEAQAQVRARANDFDERLYARLAADPDIIASPVIEAEFALADPGADAGALRIIGLDVLRAALVTPALVPAVDGADAGGSASALFGDDTIFLSNAALLALSRSVGDELRVRAGAQVVTLHIAGRLPGVASGQRLAVMDIATLQWRLGWLGRLSRIDLRFADGADAERVRMRWSDALPPDVVWAGPSSSRQRMSNLSRAYRVNLNVLALVALFTGGYIVHATLALAVARQQRELALLGVLGGGARLAVLQVLGQALVLGVAGAALGAIGGVALAAALLAWSGGDLGGGYFAGSKPTLDLDLLAIAGLAAAGVITALAGSIAPARAAHRLPAARALRAGSIEETLRVRTGPRRLAWPLACFAGGAILLAMPPVDGLPWPSYVAIAAWLAGGIALVPHLVYASRRGLARLALRLARHPIAWLAVNRLAGAPGSAAAAMSGVVASFALAAAMAIMVTSFRDSVEHWLQIVLPAQAYGRIASGAAGAAIDAGLRQRLAAVPGVKRLEFLRTLALTLDAAQPPVTLLARSIDAQQPQERLPITGALHKAPAGTIAIYVSEAMVDLYGFEPGMLISLPLPHIGAGSGRPFFVAGVWRDYARQHGAIALSIDDYRAFTGDRSTSDVALWFDPSLSPELGVLAVRRALSDVPGLELRTTGQLRERSLRIFDRSFAVTYALEAIAILVALFGVASSWAAEGLARAHEFGVLRHLGLRRHDIALLFAGEAALQITAAVAWGALLGTMLALVLVYRVNPQSFHWTMQLSWPLGLLGASATALLALGVGSALLASRYASSEAPLRSIREDW